MKIRRVKSLANIHLTWDKHNWLEIYTYSSFTKTLAVALQSKRALYKKSASFSDGNSSESIDPTTVIYVLLSSKWNQKMKIRRVKSLANIHLTWDKHMKCDGVTSVTWALNPPPECRPVIKNKNK
jgi:predicted Zn-dependent protease